MTIDIECSCGETIEHNDSIILYNEDYTPLRVKCPVCSAEFELCVHMYFINDGS